MGVLSWGYAQDTPTSSENDKGQWTRELKFIAECDSVFDGPQLVLNYYQCPQRGDTYRFQGPDRYEYDATCKVTDRKATRPNENFPIWEVAISYKTTDEEENDDPLDEPVEARGSGESYKEVAEGTVSDSMAGPIFDGAIVNSAGEPFRNPTPEKESGYNVLSLVKNYAIDYDILALNEDYAFTVSTDAFFGRAAGQWMMFPASWELKRKEPTKNLPNGRDYIRVTFTFKNKKKGWELELLDMGSYYIPAAGPLAGERVAFKGVDGQAYLGLLDGAGDKLADGLDPEFVGPFKIQPENAFAALNLPNSLTECKKMLR